MSEATPLDMATKIRNTLENKGFFTRYDDLSPGGFSDVLAVVMHDKFKGWPHLADTSLPDIMHALSVIMFAEKSYKAGKTISDSNGQVGEPLTIALELLFSLRASASDADCRYLSINGVLAFIGPQEVGAFAYFLLGMSEQVPGALCKSGPLLEFVSRVAGYDKAGFLVGTDEQLADLETYLTANGLRRDK